MSLYDILGVSKSDSCTTIKKAYLKLTRIHHPDKGGDSEMFKKITQASDILTDEKKRRLYDETGLTDDQMANQGFPGSFPFEFNMNDLFGGMFGNPPVGPQRGPIRRGKKPEPTEQTIPITLEQFYIGHKFDININRQTFCHLCEHTGAKHKEFCRKCNGQGAITQIVQLGPMTMHTTGPCLDCEGRGERIIELCGLCSGTGYLADKRSLSVHIRPGMRPEERFLFSEVCSDRPDFEKPGDAHIMLQEDPNDHTYKRFKRVGDKRQHLETKVTISLAESLVGCTIQIDGHPGYDDGLFVRLPAGSFHHEKYRLVAHGMPLPEAVGCYGDLIILIQVCISPEERLLYGTIGYQLLQPLFKEKIRITDSREETIQTDIHLDT